MGGIDVVGENLFARDFFGPRWVFGPGRHDYGFRVKAIEKVFRIFRSLKKPMRRTSANGSPSRPKSVFSSSPVSYTVKRNLSPIIRLCSLSPRKAMLFTPLCNLLAR